jgi:hypothetical protein
MTIGPTSQCHTCQHFRSPFSGDGTGEGGPTCAAFPDGIPEAILTNQVDHRDPQPGDHGIQWQSDGQDFPEWAFTVAAPKSVGWEQDLAGALALADPTARAAALDEIAKEQSRDHLGRFSSGGGGGAAAPAGGGAAGGGAGGGGIRASLANAKTTDEVSTVLASEATALTGRPVHVDLAGADVHVARQYAEGTLKGFEKFPNTRVQVVTTYGPGSNRPELFTDHHDAFAVSSIAPREPNGVVYHHAIGFNAAYSNARGDAVLAYSESSGFTVHGGHVSTALHEYGHHVDRITGMDIGGTRSLAIAAEHAKAAGVTRHAYVKANLSKYATTNKQELFAEGFADAMQHGSGAADLSRALLDEASQRYDTRYGGSS